MRSSYNSQRQDNVCVRIVLELLPPSPWKRTVLSHLPHTHPREVSTLQGGKQHEDGTSGRLVGASFCGGLCFPFCTRSSDISWAHGNLRFVITLR